MDDKRIFIFSGYYGSGKTEVATNFVLNLRKKYEKVAIADMDVVNPYFRSRDKEELFKKNGVRLIAPPAKINSADLPYLTADIVGTITDESYKLVLDMGGDDVGTIPLGSVKTKIEQMGNYEVFMIVNINRPFTNDVDGILKMADMIKEMSGLTPSAIISNTHLKELTTEDMVFEGADVAFEAAKRLGIKFSFVSIPHFLNKENVLSVVKEKYSADVLELGLFYDRPWDNESPWNNKVGGVI